MDEWEPMDVERSGSSASKMDISLESDLGNQKSDECLIPPDIETRSTRTSKPCRRRKMHNYPISDTEQKALGVKVQPRSNIKKYHIKIEPEDKVTFSKTQLGLGIFILCVSALLFHALDHKCIEDLDIEDLSKSFSENLFGQYVAKKKMLDALNHTKYISNILFLYGGTGVGKTYAAYLILKNIWNATNVDHYTMPSFTNLFSPSMAVGLSVCNTYFLVVDDVTVNDKQVTSHIEKLVARSAQLKKKVTIILIYNCDHISDDFIVDQCDELFEKSLKESFSAVEVKKNYVKFQPLTQQHLIECVEKELKNKKLSEDELEDILKNFNVTVDGCKGVYTKMKYYNVD